MEKQISFQPVSAKHRDSYGGTLRRSRKGRGVRPLACKLSLHVVFKINRSRLKHRSLRSNHGFKLIHAVVQRYANMFFVKVEQISIQHDHLHLLIRTSTRSSFHFFFRVVAGQIAQEFLKRGLSFEKRKRRPKPRVTGTPHVTSKDPGTSEDFWKHRPFSRVVRGYRACKIVRDYIQLNEKEVLGVIRYSKRRLRGLSSSDWRLLWELNWKSI